MKKIIALIMMFGMLGLACQTVVNSASDSGNIPVTATIQAGTPDATFKLYKVPDGRDVDFTTEITTGGMNFNQFNVLTMPGKAPQWASSDHYAVVVWAKGNGKKYYIKSTSNTASFAFGANRLPAGSFACIPVFASKDKWDFDNNGVAETEQGGTDGVGQPGATLSGHFNAITNGVAQNVYVSDALGIMAIVQVRYAFPPYKLDGSIPYTGYNPIPLTQATGTYTGVNVKVSITE